MHLIIDIAANRISIDGTWFKGQRRWEAAALAAVIGPDKAAARREVGRERLSRYVADLGQDRDFDRSGWLRLWTSVSALFDAAGRADDFSRRFGHMPRSLTVGPWTWTRQRSDKTEVVTPVDSRPSGEMRQLHAVAADGSLAATFALARKLAVVHSMWLHGSRLAAIDELSSGAEWALAAPPIQAHRALTLADAYAMTEQFDLAQQQVVIALDLIDRHPTCADQRPFARLVEISISKPGEFSLWADLTISRQLVRMLDSQRHSGNEIDARTRAWTYMHAAFGVAADAAQSTDRRARALAKPECTDLLSAALCMAIVGWYSDMVPVCLEGYMRQPALDADLPDAAVMADSVDAYIAAQHWRSKLELPRSFEFGMVWMSMLIGAIPALSTVIDQRVADGLWVGPRTDSLQFVNETLTRCQGIADPKLTARAALGCYRFATRAGDQPSAIRAERVFLEVCRQRPTTFKMLQGLEPARRRAGAGGQAVAGSPWLSCSRHRQLQVHDDFGPRHVHQAITVALNGHPLDELRHVGVHILVMPA